MTREEGHDLIKRRVHIWPFQLMLQGDTRA